MLVELAAALVGAALAWGAARLLLAGILGWAFRRGRV
jgi:hypothetical protein